MRAITIQHPWAWAIVYGPKRIENRTWATSYRGPIAIHAGKGLGHLKAIDPEEWRERFGIDLPPMDRCTLGAVLGTAYLFDCVTPEDLPPEIDARWADGPWCFLLRDVQPLPAPIPCPGKLSIWNLPAGILTPPPAPALQPAAALQ